MTKDALQSLMAHILRTLPDSVTEREPILDALLELLPDSHPQYRQLAEMKIHLEQHELLRRQLPSCFTEAAADKTQSKPSNCPASESLHISSPDEEPA